MTIEEIKELVQVVNETGIAELEVQRGENRVRIRRNIVQAPPSEIVLTQASAPLPPVSAAGVVLPAAGVVLPPAAVPSSQTNAQPAEIPSAKEDSVLVKSPIVGTYYDSPSPGAPAFVKVGDTVHPGQVLCIIESMKLMNEIEAEVSGVVVSKLVENGRPVEYGEALFALTPTSR